MRQRYNNNTKSPKPKENQLEILKIYVFCQKIQHNTLGPGERCWFYVSIYENAPKICCIFPLKVATTLLSGSEKGTTGVWQSHSYSWCRGYMPTLQALAYIEGYNGTSRPI